MGDEQRMLRSSWSKALTVSLLLHCLLLLGIGWRTIGYTLTPQEEQHLEVEIVPDTGKKDVPPVVSEATVAESLPETELPTHSNKETQESQPQTENERDVSPAKNSPPTDRMSDKDAQTLMLSVYSKEQLELALAKYNLLLTVDSPFAFLYSDRGQIYYDKGDYDKALADFNKALVLDPQLPVAHIGRGFIYIKRNRWDLALDDFNQAIKSAPKNVLAYYGRALCFINNNDKQKAINDLRSVMQYATSEDNRLIQIVKQLLSGLGG